MWQITEHGMTPAEDDGGPAGRIRQLLGERLGCDVDELAPTYRLKTDLGMEGNCAVGFFLAYAKEFDVDLTALWASWPFYFHPEGIQISMATRLAWIVAGSAGLLQWLFFPQMPGLTGFVTAAVLFLILMLSIRIAERLNRGMEKPNMQEITIGDLIQAARIGKWKIAEEIEEWSRIQKKIRPLV